ncbi:serpentine type 7TM GPCR chemoreceptor srt domain-containing protein [Ditylenchus destructor]|uniref:Serpentine type 7TM GPCR chemoreceptor srt domain-containing protein n=1 Tax=Ditylenchus destructor TaxID=166010 RepID=A0AAD4NE02_9BILA|nr:serpentine type 7TM GPCR chemoreceptor srt domain-containing protein [Ditylenchus destructor]
MSLYTLIFNHEEFQRYYNCSTYDVNEIPVEDRRGIGIGILYIGIGIFIEVIYLPCLWAIWRLMDKRDSECYRLMFILGVIDCSSIVINAFLVGYSTIAGDIIVARRELYNSAAGGQSLLVPFAAVFSLSQNLPTFEK